MTSSRTRLFKSVRLFGSGSALALGKVVRVTRNGLWLTILVAGCCSSAFALTHMAQVEEAEVVTRPLMEVVAVAEPMLLA